MIMAMKLFTYPQAPSPRRIHLFLAEKGMEIEQHIVDIRAGEQHGEGFAGKSRQHTVPLLELDDGTCLGESMAICRYLEEIQPDPPLLGRDARERALVNELDHWLEMNGLLAVMDGFRNAVPGLKDRALPGPRPVPQIPELAERGRRCYRFFMQDLDGLLTGRKFLAGDYFSVADITALVIVDFASWGIKARIPLELQHLSDWHRRVSARPTIATCS